MKCDVLVVGQGLAGTALAWSLIRAGKSVLVIDRVNPASASMAAAGLYNPITGPNLALAWDAHRFFPVIEPFYREIEKETGESFLHPMPIYRPFNSAAQQNDWSGRWSDPRYNPFIASFSAFSKGDPVLRDPWGGLTLAGGGFLDLPMMLSCFRSFLAQRGMLLDEHFDAGHLTVGSGNVLYKAHRAERIVFCTGHRLPPGSRFDWLPLKPLKGETLLLKVDADIETIYNRGCFIIPLQKGLCRAGSTYNRNDLSTVPTENGRSEIEKKLNNLISASYDVVGQAVGIRPASVDRRPLLGFHPEFPVLGVFNGLGSRGVSMAPVLSRIMTRNLLQGTPIEMSVKINRFNSLYFASNSDSSEEC